VFLSCLGNSLTPAAEMHVSEHFFPSPPSGPRCFLGPRVKSTSLEAARVSTGLPHGRDAEEAMKSAIALSP